MRTAQGDALDADDVSLLFLAIDLLDRFTQDELAKAGNSTKQTAMIHTRSRILIVRGKLRAMHGELEAATRGGSNA